MQNLDLWLEQVDTTETLPLFSQEPSEYTIPTRSDVLSPSDPPWLIEVFTHENLELLTRLESVDQYKTVFKKATLLGDKGFLLRSFQHLLGNINEIAIESTTLVQAMIETLSTEPTLAIAFVPFLRGPEKVQHGDVSILLETSLLPIIRSFVLSANTMGHLILDPLQRILSNIPPGSLSLSDLADIMELAALTLRSTNLALELFLDCLQPNATRFMTADSKLVHHLLRNLSAIALDHIEEAGDVAKPLPGLHTMKLYPKSKDGTVVEIDFRIDGSGTPKKSSHVRLTAASLPSNMLVGTKYSMDALVEFSETGRARFKCLHPLPSYFADCSWVLEDCGPFVTSKSMIDAVSDLNVYQEQCCGIADMILGLPSLSPLLPTSTDAIRNISNLNESQNEAIQLSLSNPLLCLWGPPGTGKTATIVEMICALQMADESARILVTAPTHNAVDNVMRRYIFRLEKQPLSRKSGPNVVRVSTEVGCIDSGKTYQRGC